MKKQFLILFFISLSLFIVGCEGSSGESKDQKTSTQTEEGNSGEENKIILVGTPFSNEERSGVNMNEEISDSKNIVKVEDVIGTAENIDKPEAEVEGTPDVFFKIAKSGETYQDSQEERRFVWYQEDGSAVFSDGSGEYHTINSSQAKELKEALN
ncbi:hypothetical protein [Halobacillus litoralis]|uniref:Lipoprotein n=1 Tax=Halobacillus litoralis TaxID=45668 RepID=A0A410M9V8_9BACI|nr:hypothetical protein [Halobacillus litoralis]QAS51458.1 hypothetical protein HLI_04090 [Halobacillus litoralis]